ncbi:GNAT family N-acetyltransferase [Longispora albida]|uniref:GNAT family N-acetyltransferase n=1 Tax=Longispora albida TaxID=203523 RepID=UPI000363E4F8|nr:GNAT family N-acetyltransferase [Longispora albida]
MELHTPRLLLRRLTPADIPDVARAGADPGIRRYLGIHLGSGAEAAESFVTVAPEEKFAICDAGTGEFLGSAGLIKHEPAWRRAEIAYWLAPAARGRGVAAEAVTAVLRWGFEDLRLIRIGWRAEIGNHASRRVAEAAGFRYEGRARQAVLSQDGELADAWIAAITARDWTAYQHGFPMPEPQGSRVFEGGQPVLTSGKVTLRPMRPSDAPGLAATAADPLTQEFTGMRDMSLENAERYIAGKGPTLWRLGDGAVFAFCGPDGEFAGEIGIEVDKADRTSAEVSYVASPAARGKGYTTDAVRAVTEWGFSGPRYGRIYLRAEPGNIGSIRVAEKAGYTVEGTARGGLYHGGVRRDVIVAARLATDPD